MSYNLFNGRLVRLRALEPSDAETVFRFRQDSDILRREGRSLWPQSLAKLRQQIEKVDSVASRPDNQELVIETLDGVVVGEINTQLANLTHGTFSVGISLGERAVWGKGYAKEAMLLVLRFMFLDRPYQKCNIGIFAFNERSLGLYQHLGFQEEGRIRRNYFTNGQHHDEISLGMLREEFIERYAEWMDE